MSLGGGHRTGAHRCVLSIHLPGRVVGVKKGVGEMGGKEECTWEGRIRRTRGGK